MSLVLTQFKQSFFNPILIGIATDYNECTIGVKHLTGLYINRQSISISPWIGGYIVDLNGRRSPGNDDKLIMG